MIEGPAYADLPVDFFEGYRLGRVPQPTTPYNLDLSLRPTTVFPSPSCPLCITFFLYSPPLNISSTLPLFIFMSSSIQSITLVAHPAHVRQEKNPAWTFRYGMRMQIVYPKGQTRKEPIAWTFRYGMRMVQIVYPKGQTRKEPIAWTFRYGMRMVQIVYPKGQTRKEPSLDIQVWYVNGADHLPQRTDKKRT